MGLFLEGLRLPEEVIAAPTPEEYRQSRKEIEAERAAEREERREAERHEELEKALKRLEKYRIMQGDLASGQITPADIVGRSYEPGTYGERRARKRADEHIDREIREQEQKVSNYRALLGIVEEEAETISEADELAEIMAQLQEQIAGARK
jgi:hypothetical protein